MDLVPLCKVACFAYFLFEMDQDGLSTKHCCQLFTFLIRGLIPHCLEILKTCHDLTEKLVAMTIGNTATVNARESSLGDIVVIAKRISPR